LQGDAKPLAKREIILAPVQAEDFDIARRWRLETFENLDGGRLAGTVRAKQTKAFAWLDFEI
jgi:hypothetical protein